MFFERPQTESAESNSSPITAAASNETTPDIKQAEEHGDGVNILGKVGNSGASPTSVLKEVMASWSWDNMEAANKNDSAVPSYQMNEDYQIRAEEDTVLIRASSTNSMPNALDQRAQRRLQAVNNNAGAVSSSDESFHSMSMPPAGGSGSAAHKQQEVPNNTTTSTSKTLGVAKRPTKRRPRASRRVPTTVLEAQSRDFRDIVLKLTGFPAAAAPTGDLGGHILRPQPQRANSVPHHSTLDRTGLLPAQSLPSPYMDSHPVHPPNLPTHISGMSFLQELQRGNSGHSGHGSAFPFLAPKTEGREILDRISTSRPFGVTERSTTTNLTRPIGAPTLPSSSLNRFIERPRNLTRPAEQAEPDGSRQVASETQSRQASQSDQLSLHQIDWLSYK